MAIATGQIDLKNIKESINIILSKDSHVFAGGTTSALAGATDIVITTYVGDTSVPFTIGTITGVPNGMSKTVSAVSGTNNQKVNIAVTTSMSTASGVLVIPITVNGAVINKSFSYAIAFEGAAGRAISSVDVEFAKNTSTTNAPSTGWNTTAPGWQEGYYIWSRTVTKYSYGSDTVSTPVCITGGVGQTGKGVASINEQYYLSSSKTSLSGGSWVDNPPDWEKGKYIWTRSKIVYSNPTGTEYTTAIVDTSWEASEDVRDYLQDYINSRGENLLTNGTGLLGNNTNFPGFTFETSEAYGASGSFTHTISNTPFTEEFMPVNPDETYRLTMYAKQTKGSPEKEFNKQYAFVDMYDTDKLQITATHIMWMAGTLTTLAQDLKPGDTVVHLTSAANWKNNQGTSTHQRGFIFWHYKNSGGYEYPPETYSRYATLAKWLDGAVDYANNTITLTAPWNYSNPQDPEGIWRAGHKLSNSDSGGTFAYNALTGQRVEDVWTKYTGTVSGTDLSGRNNSSKFRPGTAYVKIGWLIHYQGGQTSNTAATNNKIYLSNLSFNKDVASRADVDKAIISTDVEYYASTSSTGLSGGTWQTTAPALSAGEYLWSRTKIVYGSGAVEYRPSSTGTNISGVQGRGVASVAEQYYLSTSSTAQTGGSWSSNVPTWADGKYMWTRTVITYTTGSPSTSTTDPICVTGAKGNTGPQGATGAQGPKGDTGTGVTGVTEYYLATSASSGVTTDTPGWTTNMQTMTTTNKYLWNYEVITFSDGTNPPTVPVIIGVYGNTGSTGATGRSLTTVTEYYLTSSSASGVTRGTSGWETDMQATTPEKPYLWNYEKLDWSSGTTPTYIEPIIIGTHGAKGDKGDTGNTGPQGLQGIQGPKGDQGIAGPKGTDGLTSYTHIAYATGTSGQNFSTSHFSAATYIGMYTDFTAADSTNYTSYKWSLIKGADGTQGIQGPKGDDGLTPYFHTAWANNSTGSSGFSTTVSTDKLYIGTYTDHTEADSSDHTKYKWVKIKGETGDAGPDGYTVILTNESHVFPGLESKAVAGSSVTSNIIVYKGPTQIASSVAVTGAPTGMTVTVSGNVSTSNSFTAAIHATTAMTTMNGELTVTVTADGKTFPKKFSFAVAKKGTDGTPGSPGAPAKIVKIVPSALYFVTNTVSSNPASYVYAPSSIALTPTFQSCTYALNGWKFSTNGSTWANITTQNGLSINSTSKVLTVSSSSTLFSTTQTFLIFKCESSTGEADVVTLNRIFESGALGSRLTTAESNISQQADEIALKVTQTQVDSTVAAAKSTNYGYRYAHDIIVYGDSDKYYPVIIKGGDQNVKRDILVRRGYSELAPPDWYSATHKGGLTLKIKTNFGGWGGANYSWEIHELEEMYSRTFAGAMNVMSQMAFAIFLRGGGTTGAIYHLYSDQQLDAERYNDAPEGKLDSPQIAYSSDQLIGYTSGGTYTWYAPAPRTITEAVEEEIRIRKFIKLAQDSDTAIKGISSDISDINDEVSGLKNFTDTAFADGVVTRAEKEALKSQIERLNVEKADVDNRYSSIYGDVALVGTSKTNLYNAKGAYNTAHSNLISSINTAVADSTITSTERTDVSNKYGTYSTALATLSTRFEEAIRAIETQKVDNIQVGGRNLIANTKDLNGYSYRTNDKYMGFNIAKSTTGSTGYIDTFSATTIDIASANVYTVSFYAKADVNRSIRCHWYSPNTTTSSKSSTGYNGTGVDGTCDVDVTTEWKRYWVTWTQSETTSVKKLIVGRNSVPNSTLEIVGVKLEEGNKPTDWSPAPEDDKDYVNKSTYLPVRYIRDWENGSSSNTSNHWYEIQAYADGVNVALGKPASTDGVISGGTYLTDGLTSGSYMGAGSGKCYAQVDLGQVFYNIQSIKVWRYHNDGRTYRETKTEVSPDGVTWYTVFDSYIEGEYAETAAGKEFPNTWARHEALTGTKSIATRVSSAEQKITPEAITSTVTQSTTYKNDLSSKNKIFASQPTPPYIVGDLWVQGSGGDAMRCKTARATGSYTASDWEKAVKYTDDSASEPRWIKSSTEPSNPVNGMIWLDTTEEPYTPQQWLDGEWIVFVPTKPSDIGAFSDTDAQALIGRVTSAEQSITSDNITSTVTENQIFLDKLSGFLTDEQIGTKIEQNLESVTTSVTTLQKTIDGDPDIPGDTGLAGELQTVRTYMTFDTNGLLLGKSNSPLQISIDNDEMQFLNAGAKIAWITGQEMSITKVTVTTSIKIGVHEIYKYNNDITVIKWVG